jgi:hypothetical protein
MTGRLTPIIFPESGESASDVSPSEQFSSLSFGQGSPSVSEFIKAEFLMSVFNILLQVEINTRNEKDAKGKALWYAQGEHSLTARLLAVKYFGKVAPNQATPSGVVTAENAGEFDDIVERVTALRRSYKDVSLDNPGRFHALVASIKQDMAKKTGFPTLFLDSGDLPNGAFDTVLFQFLDRDHGATERIANPFLMQKLVNWLYDMKDHSSEVVLRTLFTGLFQEFLKKNRAFVEEKNAEVTQGDPDMACDPITEVVNKFTLQLEDNLRSLDFEQLSKRVKSASSRMTRLRFAPSPWSIR